MIKVKMKKIIIIISSILVLILLSILIYFKITFINKDEVKRIVLEDVSIEENDINLYEASLELESKTFIYEVSFVYDKNEYDYVIDAKTGNIILSKIDND